MNKFFGLASGLFGYALFINRSRILCYEPENKHSTKFRPCIDIHAGKVKQIVGSTLEGKELKTNFVSDKPASYYAELYKRDNLFGGHVISLGKDKQNDDAAIAALQAYPNALQIGGGINPDNAKQYLKHGASHVIVTSYIFVDGKLNFERLQKLNASIGKQHLIIDLSCRKKDDKYYVVTDRWQTFTDFIITKENLTMLSAYCDEFLIHAVDVEGMQTGIIDELVELLGKWSPIPVTYAGGARSIADLDRVQKMSNGKVDVSIGSALDIFGGNLKYADVVAWNNRNIGRKHGPTL